MDLLTAFRKGDFSGFTTENLIMASSLLSIPNLVELIHLKLISTPDYYFVNNPNVQFTGFFRGRNHNRENGMDHTEFVSESEFWNPPNSAIKSRGRCNNIGESFLYCSNKLSTAIIETRPVVGSFISVANFAGLANENNDLFPLDISYVGIDYLKQIFPSHDPIHDIDTSDFSKESVRMNAVFDEIFHYRISPGNEHIYKLSGVLTRFFLNALTNDSPSHGMIYSSILRNKKSFNILLFPGIAQRYFVITDIITYKVLNTNNIGIDLEIIRRGNVSNDNSSGQCFRKIIWDDKVFPREKFTLMLFDSKYQSGFI